MARIRETIEMHIEIDDELLPVAIAQAAQIDKCCMAQMLLPAVLRQVFIDLPATAQINLQLPQLGVSMTPLLENKHG